MKKKILTCSLLFLLTMNLYPNAINGIAVNIYVSENASLQRESRSYLIDKISKLLSENNILEKNYSDRFYLMAKVHITEKNIVEGMPQRISIKMDVTFKIGDAIDNIVYSTFTQTYIGIGTNEIKSEINAISQIKSNTSYTCFFNNIKERISEYYSLRCETIIKEAELYSQNKEYNKAIYKLSLVPHGVTCYNNILKMMKKIYADKIEYENLVLLSKAQQVWNSCPNKEGAHKAINYLEHIKIEKSNQKEIEKLLASINSKLQSDEVKEWQFKMKQYEQQHALKLQEKQNEADILNTCLQIGYDFVSSNLQPANIIKNLLLW